MPQNPRHDRHVEWSGLQKGDAITVKELLQCFPELLTISEDAWNFFLLDERDRGEKHFQRLGTPACIKVEGKGLRILTDQEATHYLAQQQEIHRRALRKNLYTLAHVVRENLTSDEQKAHERRLITESLFAQAQQQAEKSLGESPKVRRISA